MSINNKRRITVNFSTIEAANEIKQAAKGNDMSPSQWIIHRLDAVEILEALWEATKSVNVS